MIIKTIKKQTTVILLIFEQPETIMDDPTGGMWIYFIFFLIPAARLIPRMIRKYKAKQAGVQPEQLEQQKQKQKQSQPEPRWKPDLKPKEPFFEEEKPQKKDGWLNKEDFK